MDLLQEYMEEEDAETLVQKFHETMNADERLEFIVILEKMLWFGPSSSMKRFVRILLDQCQISTIIKCRMSEQVYEADDPVYVEKIRKWCKESDMELACRIEWMEKISFYPNYQLEDKIHDWIQNVFDLVAEDPFYRFRTLMQAFTIYQDFDFPTFVQIVMAYRAKYQEPVMNQILLTETFIKKDKEKTFEEGDLALHVLQDCLESLLKVLLDTSYSMEVQADVCDFFLHTDYPRITSVMRETAHRVMTRLFQENMTSHLSVFANRQNVHNESIEKSSEEVISKLHQKYSSHVHSSSLPQWKQEVEEWELFTNLSEDQQTKIILCFHRIQFDNRVYGKTNDSLQSIFALVWRHIQTSKFKEELQKRLLEEMIEASGQCSSGIAVRLVNTLSGFDDFMLRISYRDAILAKVVNHMNKVIMETEDETLRDSLLEEMILPNSEYLERKNFLTLLRKEIPTLKEDLYNEYKDVMTDTDFDLYLKQAFVHYEGQTN